METDYMETLARAYNTRLHTTSNSANIPLLEEARDIIERQINYIDQIMSSYKQSNRALAYLKSLKQAAERELITLGAGSKVPSYALPVQDKSRNPFNSLVDLQIDLFITLDTIKEEGVSIDKLLDCEIRVLGFLGLLR